MKLSVNTCIAAACLTLLVASVQAGADRKKTCLVLNKASSFIDLTNTDKTCADDCTGDWATCKCKSFGTPTKVSYSKYNIDNTYYIYNLN